MIVQRSTKPILAADREWEEDAVCLIPHDVFVEDGNRLRIYYSMYFREARRCGLCIAWSADGVRWEKPNLGDGTNVVMRTTGERFGWGDFVLHSIVRDDAEEDPAQRWKMAYWDQPAGTPRAGIWVAVSADGLAWRPVGDRPVITGMNDAFSLALLSGEPGPPVPSGRHVIYQQTWRYNPALPIDRDNLKGRQRCISAWASGVFGGGWTGPMLILQPDADDPPDVQFYTLQVFTVEGGYGGFLWRHHTIDQMMDVEAVRSHDGWLWERPHREKPVLAPGRRGGFDGGMVHAWSAPVLWHGRCLVFYCGEPRCHDGASPPGCEVQADVRGGVGLAEFEPGEFAKLFAFTARN